MERNLPQSAEELWGCGSQSCGEGAGDPDPCPGGHWYRGCRGDGHDLKQRDSSSLRQAARTPPQTGCWEGPCSLVCPRIVKRPRGHGWSMPEASPED